MEMTNITHSHLKDLHVRRISYVLITKDRAQEVKKTLALLPDLIGPDDELIIIDGASQDDTKKVVEAAGDLVDVFVSEKDAGTSDANNKGMMLARGKYIRLLCDDDITHREAMEHVVAVMDAHPEIDLLMCGGIKHAISKDISYTFYVPPGTNYGTRIEDAFIYGINGTGLVIRTASLTKIGFLPLDWYYANDIAFMAQCINRGGVVRFCRINLFDHYIWNQSISRVKKKESDAERKRVMQRYCSRSFLIKQKLKKMPMVRMLRIFLFSAIISRFIILAWDHGFLHACKRAARMARGKNISQKTTPIYQWDGGLS